MFYKVLRRLESNRDLALTVIRVYLGAGLFFRGLALLVPGMGLEQLTGGAALGVPLTVVALYVTAAHLVGGALLLVGFYTRLAALIQLPVLVGAVFLVHWQSGLLSANQSLEFSVLVLYLLVIVCVFGGGRWSLDERWGDQFSSPADSSPASDPSETVPA